MMTANRRATSDDCALHATMAGNLHAPGLEPRPLAAVGHQERDI
jgi:hypothetical protein